MTDTTSNNKKPLGVRQPFDQARTGSGQPQQPPPPLAFFQQQQQPLSSDAAHQAQQRAQGLGL